MLRVYSEDVFVFPLVIYKGPPTLPDELSRTAPQRQAALSYASSSYPLLPPPPHTCSYIPWPLAKKERKTHTHTRL